MKETEKTTKGCSCIEEVSNRLLEQMKKAPFFTEVLVAPMFKHLAWLPEVKLYFPATGKYLNESGRPMTYQCSVTPKYCPFCGKKTIKKEIKK